MLLLNKIKLDYAYVVFVTDYKHVTYLASRNDISPEQKLVEKCMRFLLGEKIDIDLLETLKKKL